jgi:hypothetical protein
MAFPRRGSGRLPKRPVSLRSLGNSDFALYQARLFKYRRLTGACVIASGDSSSMK